MESFSKELLRLGTLRGFVHFTCYLRGREELLVTINRQTSESTPQYLGAPETSSNTSTASYPSASPGKLLKPDHGGKPPASPASNETSKVSDSECVFLIGAYQRYKSPFVWLRNGHLEAYAGIDRDIPLKLQTTTEWAQKKAHPWDIVAELVNVAVRPRPVNPFALDFEHLEALPVVQSAICTAALMHTLQEVLLAKGHRSDERDGRRNHPPPPSAAPGASPFALEELMLEDLQRLAQLHFVCMGSLADQLANAQSSPPHTQAHS